MTEIVRHIIVEGGFNVRDLGGYPTEDGRVTRARNLIRSGNLDQLTDAGQQKLLEYGLKTVIDLRDDAEIVDTPDVFARSTRVQYLHRPLFHDDHTAAEGLTYTHLDTLYSHYLSSLQENIYAIMSSIAESEPGILFHCAVGKDRTGIVSALLLGTAGVPREVIAEDYAQTTQLIAHLIHQWREWSLAQGQNMVDFERDIAADAEIMLATFDFLNRQYGGIVNYLRGCGISDQQLTRLKSLLIE